MNRSGKRGEKMDIYITLFKSSFIIFNFIDFVAGRLSPVPFYHHHRVVPSQQETKVL